MAEIRRILAVKLADLGDVLVTEPALRSLRTAFPNAEIHVLTTPKSSELLDLLDSSLIPVAFPKSLFDSPRGALEPGNVRVAGELALRLRRTGFDLVVLFHHLTTQFGAIKFRSLVQTASAPYAVGLDNGRGNFLTSAVEDRGFGERHEADYMLAVARMAGGAEVDSRPTLTVPTSMAERFSLDEPYIAVFPATGPYSRAREWPASRFAELTRRLVSSGLQVAIIGGSDAQPAARQIIEAAPGAIDLTGQTTIAELSEIVAGASLAIGGDTFAGHLAAAVGTPVVSIFGPSNVQSWKPYGSANGLSVSIDQRSTGVVVRQDVPCAPCLYTGYRLGRPQGCPTRTCIHTVTIDQVEEAVHKLRGARLEIR